MAHFVNLRNPVVTAAASCIRLAGMDATTIPVVVRMEVKCVRCGHHEDETYHFELPIVKAQPKEAYKSGKCPDCGASVQIHLKRTQQMQ